MEGFFEKLKKRLESLKKLPGFRRAGSAAPQTEKAKLPGAARKKYIAWGCAGALVLMLAVMPMAASARQEESRKASILSGKAELRELETKVLGGGQLSGEASVSVTVPEAVKIDRYLVQNGDTVEKGQAIAQVDEVSVMSAIASVQETLDYLSEEISALSGEADSQTVSAGAQGLVKLVYAQKGDSVAELMLEHGALAVLSLDGLMAVRIETDSAVKNGETVLLNFPDGSEAEGSVKSVVEGTLTVTVEDDDYEPGTEVTVSTEDGESLGSGELYINSPWKVTAYTGDVSYVYIESGQQVYQGQSLFALENTGHSAEYRQLVDQHQDYEELMEELFQMYESRTVTAPCDGIVTGVDEEGSYMLLSSESSTGGLAVSPLVNYGSDSASGGIVLLSAVDGGTQLVEDGTQLVLDNAQPLEGGTQLLGGVEGEGDGGTEPETGGGTLTGQISITTTSLPGATVGQSYSAQLTASNDTGVVSGSWSASDLPDGLSLDASAGIISGVPTAAGNYPITVSFTASDGSGGAQASLSLTVSAEQSQPSAVYRVFLVTDESGKLLLLTRLSESGSQTPGQGGMEGGMTGGMSGAMGGMTSGSGGTASQEESQQLYSLEEVSIASVSSQEHMSLEIQVDELDISNIQLGQDAVISVDALGGEQFDATVTGIANTGENEGGNSKFAVELTLKKSGDMLPGMSASASISLGSSGNVLCVPVAALDKDGSQDIIYTSCDSGSLGNPVAVTTGISDGEYVQLLSGLEEGQDFYYAWYEDSGSAGEADMAPPFGP